MVGHRHHLHNADHGKRRSNADKRRAVEMMLKDSEWGKWSDREIAAKCAVGAAGTAFRFPLCGFRGDKQVSGNGYIITISILIIPGRVSPPRNNQRPQPDQ